MDTATALHWIARAIELGGVAIIVGGIVVSTLIFARDALSTRDNRDAIERYRANLGRGILLGLEFLVGADIIATITAPLTWASIGQLGLLVLVRTFLSFSLETEIEGVFPWNRRRMTDGEDEAR